MLGFIHKKVLLNLRNSNSCGTDLCCKLLSGQQYKYFQRKTHFVRVNTIHLPLSNTIIIIIKSVLHQVILWFLIVSVLL